MTDYARATMDANQGTPGDDGPSTPAPPPAYAIWSDADAVRLAEQAAHARRIAAELLGGRVHQGLLRWIGFTIAGSLLAVVFQHPDAAFLLAFAALFALAQSWDVRDRARIGELRFEPALAPGGVGVLLRALVPLAVP